MVLSILKTSGETGKKSGLRRSTRTMLGNENLDIRESREKRHGHGREKRHRHGMKGDTRHGREKRQKGDTSHGREKRHRHGMVRATHGKRVKQGKKHHGHSGPAKQCTKIQDGGESAFFLWL